MNNNNIIFIITVIFIYLFSSLFLGINRGFSQNLGINEPNPDNSALLEMTSSERGLLIPRMTTVQRDAIASPAQSLLIYNITDMCLQIWEDAQWNDIWCSTPCVAPAITSHPVDVSINDGGDANCTVTATGTAILSYQWQESTDGGTIWSDISNGGTNPAYSGATTSSLTLTNVPLTYDTYDYQCVVTNACGLATSNSADLEVTISPVCGQTCGFTTTVVDVTNAGQTWMDRNLGATQQATAYNDYCAYGALFQWGRLSDDHECITWTNSTTGTPDNGTTATNSSTDDPGHSLFITEGSFPNDWRSPQNDNLWQGVSGINNPCPSGYRLPTDAELEIERTSWGTNDYFGAYGSPLKFVVAGYRFISDGSLLLAGSFGFYWSSTVDVVDTRFLRFQSPSAAMVSTNRAYGFSVRCIKD